LVGLAASMGSMFLVAGTKGKRFALPHSRIMIHQPAHGTQGKISDTLIAVEEGLRLKKMLTQLMTDRTNKTFEEVEIDMDRDKWLSPEEALEYGIIDGIISK